MSTPTLSDAYTAYLITYAPVRGTFHATATAPIADFVEVLRENGTDTQYSDEEWIAFLLPYVDGDSDKARDLWDALLCQPSYAAR